MGGLVVTGWVSHRYLQYYTWNKTEYRSTFLTVQGRNYYHIATPPAHHALSICYTD